MRRRNYIQHYAEADGWSKWIWPAPEGYRLSCCDCGLVHLYKFKHERYGRGIKILYKVRRLNRETAGKRRAARFRDLVVPKD